jgi:hypothetical protein
MREGVGQAGAWGEPKPSETSVQRPIRASSPDCDDAVISRAPRLRADGVNKGRSITADRAASSDCPTDLAETDDRLELSLPCALHYARQATATGLRVDGRHAVGAFLPAFVAATTHA